MKLHVYLGLGNFRDLPGHVGGIELGQGQGVVDLDLPHGCLQIGIGRCLFSDWDIDAAMLGIPATGDDNIAKKVSGCMQGQSFLFFFCLGVIPGKGGGNEQNPQDADKAGVSLDFHKMLTGIAGEILRGR